MVDDDRGRDSSHEIQEDHKKRQGTSFSTHPFSTSMLCLLIVAHSDLCSPPIAASPTDLQSTLSKRPSIKLPKVRPRRASKTTTPLNTSTSSTDLESIPASAVSESSGETTFPSARR